MITDIDFSLFLKYWNRRQGLRTPQLHLDMAHWLEQSWKNGDKRLLLMAFRSSGKSTICGIFSAWLLYRNPDLRILVVAADADLSEKLVRNVKKIIERHPLTAHLKPRYADQWANERFTVNRTLELRDPSMLARGISSNITGSRADIVICDDVEVPNTCDTVEKRRGLREQLGELNFILSAGGTVLYVGTPHSYYTIYADAPRTEIGETVEFLTGYRRYLLPVLDQEGKSAWPKRFTPDDIESMRIAAGPNRFASQMMLIPVNINEGRLNPSSLQIYSGNFHYAAEVGQLHIDGKVMAGASAWWDPSFGSARGDRSVLAVIFADDQGNYYLHKIEYLKNPSPSTLREGEGTDIATGQCRQVAKIIKELMLPSIAIEINGIGKFLPSILRNELAKAKAPCTVREISSRRRKDIRILEAFDTVLAAKRLHAHRDILQTPFIAEMQEWEPGSHGGHDDGLDAVAGALSQLPLRLPKIYGAGGHIWMKGANTHKAKTDFEI